jgi:hypothetical protein
MRIRTARWLAGIAFLLYVLTGGGRIVGSDEVTMFQLAQSMLHGRIDVPEGATMTGRDGRFYTKNAAAQAILALPLVAAGEAAATVAHLPEHSHDLAVRAIASFFNALVTALLLGVFYVVVRGLGVGVWPALAAALGLGFTTPIWVYAKSFMAEPLQALGLLLAVGGAAKARAGKGAAVAGLGVLLAVSTKLSMLPLALWCLLPFTIARRNRWWLAWLGLAAALVGHGIYDLARFGTPWETGYGAQATGAAYTTPLHVGLYGLLLSSGKGVVWFAPLVWLVPWGFARAWRMGKDASDESAARAAQQAAALVFTIGLVALLFYGRFQHWAGDGSFGPRYLVPILPLAFVLVAFALDQASRARHVVARVLAIFGLLVQIGGVAIYFGAQMREAGDYPYTLPLEHPRFMSDSHFNPRFSPILGHWRMLGRNAVEHLQGKAPHLGPISGNVDPRLGIPAADQQQLLHGLDFWWLYLGYAGLPTAPAIAVTIALLVPLLWSAVRLRAAARAEAPA